MQATDKAGNNGDETITRNFRSSSNFMYMKKYRKGIAITEPSSSEPSSSEPLEEPEGAAPQASVQPPLPEGPPPPSPPLVKKEVEEEDEYVLAEVEDNDSRTMCRQFARGLCTRGSSCIYTHEIIVSQLPGVYTFCRDFQNSTCSFPRCRFVHATVFEKENFYRTGQLPPHTLAHLKETTPAPSEPPPPVPAPAAPAPPPPPVPPDMAPPSSSVPPASSMPPAFMQGGQPEVPLARLSAPYPTGPALPHSGAVVVGQVGAEIRPQASALSALLAAGQACKHRQADPTINDLVAAATRQPLLAKTSRPKCSNCNGNGLKIPTPTQRVVEIEKDKLTRSIHKYEMNTAVLEKKKEIQQKLLLFATVNAGSLKAENTMTEYEKILMVMNSCFDLMTSPASGGQTSAPNMPPAPSAFVPNPSPPVFGPSQAYTPSFTPGFSTPGYASNPVFNPTPSNSSTPSYPNPTPSYSSGPSYSNPTPSYSSGPSYSNPTPSYSSGPSYSNPTPSYSSAPSYPNSTPSHSNPTLSYPSTPSYSTPSPPYSLANSTSYSNPIPSFASTTPTYPAVYEEYKRNMNVLARLLNRPETKS